MTAATTKPKKTVATTPLVQLTNATDILTGLRSQNVEVVTRSILVCSAVSEQWLMPLHSTDLPTKPIRY